MSQTSNSAFLCLVLFFNWNISGSPVWGIGNDAEIDAALQEKFLREAPEGWRHLRELLLHSRGKVRMDVYLMAEKDEKRFLYSVDSKFAFTGANHRRVDGITKSKNGREVSYSNTQNTEYVFQVQGAVGGGRYALDNIDLNPKRDLWDTKSSSEDGTWQVGPVIFGPFSIYNYDLQEICNSPSFELKKLQNTDGKIFAAFRSTHPQDGSSREVTMTMDPENSWAVTSYYFEFPSPKKSDLLLAAQGTIQYEDLPFGTTGVRIPKTAVEDGGTAEAVQTNDGSVERFEYSLTEFDHVEVPESEFTVAAFGLTKTGESLSVSGKEGRGWLLLYLNIGVLILGVGYWLARRLSGSKAR